MTPPPSTLRARAAVIVPLKQRGQRLLGRLLRRSRAVGASRGEFDGADPFLEVGRRLRAARESHGLSLRQLAQETRISITVLEALEKGWRDRLPEPAYMRTMLALLEQHLDLERGSLAAALPPPSTRRLRGSLQPQGRSVTLTSIALFATWQGVLLYAVLCLLLIYGLNRQQQLLVLQGLLPLRTVDAQTATASEATGSAERDRARVLAAYPDLRPLERARRGQGLTLLRRQNGATPRLPVPSGEGDTADSPAAAGASGVPASSAPPAGDPAPPPPAAAAQGGDAPAPRP